MPLIEVNGINIYYETRGEGAPLTLINGWGGNLNSWSKRMITLLAEKYKVITLDNRGTGRSSKPDIPYTMDMMAADVYGLLSEIGIPKTHVMGFSMGGAIAQTFGINYPEAAKTLILCGSSPGGLNSVSSDPQVQVALALIANPSPDMTERDRTIKLLYLLYPKGYVEENLEKLVLEETYVDNPTPSHALVNQSHAVSKLDTYSDLETIEIPVLVMTGEDDILVPPENSERIAEKIPHSKLVKIPGSGHGFLKQRTDEAITHVLSFLDGVMN